MRYIYLFTVLLFITGCSNSDDNTQGNPNLIDVNFSQQLSAIQVLDLEIAGNSIYVANGGLKGFFVINTGSGILAWEASDPNHIPNDCSQMLPDGINVVCQCEDNTYNLFTGQAQSNDTNLEFTMQPYRVNVSGSTITVSN